MGRGLSSCNHRRHDDALLKLTQTGGQLGLQAGRGEDEQWDLVYWPAPYLGSKHKYPSVSI